MIKLNYKTAFVRVDYDFLRLALTQPESCSVEDVIVNDDSTLTIYLKSYDETLGCGWRDEGKEPGQITISDRREPRPAGKITL
ncbi:hypothetical protein LCGC14_1736390 [marine sediment metagenome]|uniref:Uncharacterized protein n=1 Tax=marine sediment metagenome TaxID=412755 RepID=A0A0F9JND9_9ZZZZ